MSDATPLSISVRRYVPTSQKTNRWNITHAVAIQSDANIGDELINIPILNELFEIIEKV